MKNNFLLNLLVSSAIAGALLTVVFSSCNDAKRDNNSPDGKSFNAEVHDGPGAHNDTDPQNTGGMSNGSSASTAGGYSSTSASPSGNGSVGSALPADTTRGSNIGAGKSEPADKTSTTKSSEKKNPVSH